MTFSFLRLLRCTQAAAGNHKPRKLALILNDAVPDGLLRHGLILAAVMIATKSPATMQLRIAARGPSKTVGNT